MSDVLEANLPDVSWSTPLRLRVAGYAQLTKARIAGLVLLTTFVGFQLGSQASGAAVSLSLLVHAMFGTALVVAGANALNQCLELEHDRKMLRTCNITMKA